MFAYLSEFLLWETTEPICSFITGDIEISWCDPPHPGEVGPM